MSLRSTLASYTSYFQDVTSISNSLVQSQRRFLNFDKLVQKVLDPSSAKPKTVDMVAFDTNDELCLVEFKGVKKNEILVPSGNCNHHPSGICSNLKDTQKLKGNEIVSSVKLKAVESWTILEQQVCKGQKTSMSNVKSHYFVVIDMPLSVASMINSAMSGVTAIGNLPDSIRKGLLRYTKNKYRSYYYDSIEVVTPACFSNDILPKLNPV